MEPSVPACLFCEAAPLLLPAVAGTSSVGLRLVAFGGAGLPFPPGDTGAFLESVEHPFLIVLERLSVVNQNPEQRASAEVHSAA